MTTACETRVVRASERAVRHDRDSEVTSDSIEASNTALPLAPAQDRIQPPRMLHEGRVGLPLDGADVHGDIRTSEA